MTVPLEELALEKARREARDTLLKYNRLLTAEIEQARMTPESPLVAAGLIDDARRLLSIQDADLREAGLYLVALLPPEGQAYLFSTLGRNQDAKKAFARFLDAERSPLVWGSAEPAPMRDLLLDAILKEMPASAKRAKTDRGEWERLLFGALDSADREELNELLDELKLPSGTSHSRSAR